MRDDPVNIYDQDTFVISGILWYFYLESHTCLVVNLVCYDIVIVSSCCHNKQSPDSSSMSPNLFIDFSLICLQITCRFIPHSLRVNLRYLYEIWTENLFQMSSHSRHSSWKSLLYGVFYWKYFYKKKTIESQFPLAWLLSDPSHLPNSRPSFSLSL